MRISRKSCSSLLVIGSLGVVGGFVSPKIGTTRSNVAVFGAPDANNNDVVKACRNWFGAIAISSMIALHPLATPPASATSFQDASSSVHLAASVKVLDMGLPSYGDISDTKASVETVEGLAKEEVIPTAKKSRAPKEAKSSDKGGGAMSALLPSMNKKGPKMTEEQKAKQEAIQRKKEEMKAEIQAKKEAQAQERKEAQEAAQAEREEQAAIKAQEREEQAALRAQERDEKAALKEQERAEKAALREQEKEDKKKEGKYEVVEMGLPSYSESTVGKVKSVFSF